MLHIAYIYFITASVNAYLNIGINLRFITRSTLPLFCVITPCHSMYVMKSFKELQLALTLSRGNNSHQTDVGDSTHRHGAVKLLLGTQLLYPLFGLRIVTLSEHNKEFTITTSFKFRSELVLSALLMRSINSILDEWAYQL